MKKIVFFVMLCITTQFLSAQDKESVEKTCLNYIEGFYEGDTTKLIAALKPSLYKIGFWKNKTTSNYDFDGQMTYREALNYAKNVLEKKNFAKSDAPKKVEVLDIMNAIASATDNIIITTKDCTPHFPNAFTPNRDGKNYQFKILNAYDLQQYELVIYNRWGQKIFETKDPVIGWDGIFNGKLQNAGVYVWFSNFKRNDKQTSLKGTIILIR